MKTEYEYTNFETNQPIFAQSETRLFFFFYEIEHTSERILYNNLKRYDCYNSFGRCLRYYVTRQ